MKSLLEIAREKGTDKSTHGFIEHYESLLKNYRDNSFNLLEIGVYMGSSIKMWNQYFVNAKIFGIDSFEGIQGNGMRFDGYLNYYNEWKETKNTKIELVKCDQSKEEELIEFKNNCLSRNIKFKVILDDGSHLMRDQQITFAHLFDLVEDGGYYIIEDTHSSDDLNGYDLNPDFSNSTKKVFSDLSQFGKLSISYINDDSLLNSLSEKIEFSENYISHNKISQTLIIKKK